MKKDITIEEWLAAANEVAGGVEPVPPGWITMKEFGEIIHRTRSTARDRMKLLLESGKAESKTFRVPDATGRAQPRPHFRLVKNRPSSAAA